MVILEPILVGADRLDSWKAIAEYLSRDVATVRRWEKSSGLPVRRVAGSRGHSVFAYRSEIDGWLNRTAAITESDTARAEDSSHHQTHPLIPAVALVPAPAVTVAPPRPRPLWRWWLAIAAIALALMSVAWRVGTAREDPTPLRVDLRSDAIVATGPDGVERWRHTFPADEQFAINPYRPGAELLTGRNPGVVVASSHRFHPGSDVLESGQLLWLSPAGIVRKTFTFEDRLNFGTETYGEPWSITDYRVEQSDGAQAVAIAAHHFQWWPSIVAILDGQWNRRGTFVNAGWVEHVHWVSRDRLIIAGFSNPRDGGMIALLDANALDGQSPATGGTAFACTSCPAGEPIRYVVLPRSEVNRVTVSRFNRVVLQVMSDRLIARTIEVPPESPMSSAGAIDALYEFSPSLDLIRASYSDRYWDVHRALEVEGKIGHTREQCPDRDGPRAIEVWDTKTGWTTQPIRR